MDQFRGLAKPPCPECAEATMGVNGKFTPLHNPDSVAVIKGHEQGYLDVETLDGVFIGHLVCTNPRCAGSMAISGDWKLRINESDWNAPPTWDDFYRVRFVSPPLRLFTPPAKTPQAVTAASELLWINPNAAANQLRQSVEELLTHQKVNRTYLNSKNQRKRYSAHARIEILRQTRPDIAGILEAVKWIGNSGSHESSLTVENVLDGSDILAHALNQLYDRSADQIRAKAAKINSRKGVTRTSKP